MSDTLIERLQSAVGADPWCDYHLWRIALPDHPTWFMGSIGDLDDVPLWGNPRKDRHWDKSPPPYTASIDAALTLLPEESKWTISNEEPGPYCGLSDNRFGYMAATPALAICIAALKARAHD